MLHNLSLHFMLSSQWVPVIAPYQNSEPDGGRSKVVSSATKDQWMHNLVGCKLFILVVPLAAGGQSTSDLTRSSGCPINLAVNRESEPINHRTYSLQPWRRTFLHRLCWHFLPVFLNISHPGDWDACEERFPTFI